MLPPLEIVCHKGANRLAPENTLAAAQICVDWGVDTVEIDVSSSADGVLYLFHGPRVDGTTDGTGYFANLTAAEIDDWTQARGSIPRLSGHGCRGWTRSWIGSGAGRGSFST